MAGGPPRPGAAARLIPLFQSVLMSLVFLSSVRFFTAKKYMYIKRHTFHLKNNLRYPGGKYFACKTRLGTGK